MQPQLDPFSGNVHLQYLYDDLLVKANVFVDVLDKGVRKIGDMDKAAFLDTDIYKAAKIGNVVYDSGQ